jgi:hypothetical protein
MMPDLSVLNQAWQLKQSMVLGSSTIKKTGYYNTKPTEKFVQ